MAQKKHYYIPLTQVTALAGLSLMQTATISGKGDYGHAPERRVKVF